MLSINYSLILVALKHLRILPYELIKMIMGVMLELSQVNICETKGLFTIYYNNKVHFLTLHDKDHYIGECDIPDVKCITLYENIYFVLMNSGKLFTTFRTNESVMLDQKQFNNAIC